MKKRACALLAALIALSLLPAACTPKITATEDVTATVESAPTETEAASAETISAEGPAAGGTLYFRFGSEPATLDPQRAFTAEEDLVLGLVGGSLVTCGPGGEIYPYLAEAWTTSEDGLTWTFTLRQDVSFSDGTPLTAKDFAWTYQRALAPDTASPATGPLLGTVASVEATDDYTLVFTLTSPFFPFLFSLSDPGYMQPMLQSYVESKTPEELAHSPLGVGPYVLKDWITSNRIILERNPNYNWGPSFVENQGPFYIERIEFPIIVEYATALAGLETGDLDIVGGVQNRDIETFRADSRYQMVDYPIAGISPFLAMNLEKPPFDNLLVRQAFNLAVDRQALIDVMLQGNGEIQYGPLSKTVVGYWPGVEEIGYGYDLERARALMQEAGYTYRCNGKSREEKGGNGPEGKRGSKISPGNVWPPGPTHWQDRKKGKDNRLKATWPNRPGSVCKKNG